MRPGHHGADGSTGIRSPSSCSPIEEWQGCGSVLCALSMQEAWLSSLVVPKHSMVEHVVPELWKWRQEDQGHP